MRVMSEHGQSSPPGAIFINGGVNFSLYSRHAKRVELLLFDDLNDRVPSRVIPIDPALGRTYHYWHAFVPGLKSGQLYAYRVYGPADPERGLRFDPQHVLLDPYGRGVVIPKGYNRRAAALCSANDCVPMKSVLVNSADYDWGDDRPLQLPSARTIIYELHVAGFTRHPNSGVTPGLEGTYAGLVEKIPYLQQLGITAVELMPIFHFDRQDAPDGKINYWGYSPISFFAPHPEYCSCSNSLGAVNEFRNMVKALHRAGIEVILDVVFNHTAEGNESGPALSFRGIDNPTYYMLNNGGASYANFSGCGNTLNTNHPVVSRLIVDSLKYWVEEMHVDGFRFDLASILSRDANGNPLPNPPVLWAIESEPVLAGTKLLAEAWDAGGLYQVGSFAGDAWKEWNGKFRDDVRDFFRGVPGAIRRVADRMVGSPEIYGHEQREPEQSVNFVTCHDGFTLNDLVSYNQKHNEANGEENRDGSNDHRSWNCGVEGPTDDPMIERLRRRQIRNFLTLTMISLGIPMIGMGDEVRRTQRGNNNAYCQDNEISWFDWTLPETNADLLRFTRLLIAQRRLRSIHHEHQRTSLRQMIGDLTKAWHGVRLNQPDWSDESYSLAFTIESQTERAKMFVILNAWKQPLEFELPLIEGENQGSWRRWLDTALDSPNDIVSWNHSPEVGGVTYKALEHSVVVLWTPITNPNRIS
ncbi:MAG: glycogen debranching protein GlgX [Planctomyces sp.]|nr:glycogen debranching protein GlgX [Planctomyces sp.]